MSKKLLLADDSITIQKVVGITFAGEDYDLAVVGDGDTALERARLERPDLVLADVFMPGMSGYELCAAVKQDPALQGVPVLLLTGTFEPFDEGKAAAAGADGWIAKPFESQALIDRVEDLLSRSLPPAQADFFPAEAEAEIGQGTSDDDIWADLAGLAVPEEDGEPVGLDEAFAPVEGIAEDGTAPSARYPEDDIWQSLGEELPAEDRNADPFAFDTEEELPVVDAAEPLAEPPPIVGEDPFAAEEEAEVPMGAGDFIGRQEAEQDWGVATAAEGGEDDAVWGTFEDPEILDLDESDILDELEFPEDENLAAIVASMEEDEPAAAEEKEDGLRTAGMIWEPDADGGEGYASIEVESGAAGDFMAAEALNEEYLLELGADDLAEEVAERTEAAEAAPFASEDEYAFSLEEPSSEAPPGEIRQTGETSFPSVPPAPPLAVEERVASLTESEVERIVEKVAGSVIERLAQTMLERIAWEVVPDLAESMIKEEIRRIREEVQ